MMKVDSYTKIVLSVIAGALVYLCVVFTPLPTVYAQRGLRPGDDTGPAQVVIVGWRTSDRAPIQVAESVPLRISGDVQVNGLVQTEQAPNKVSRVVLAGWEERGTERSNGLFHQIDSSAQSQLGLPVTAFQR
jgi:hypothetical protein